MLFDKVHIYLLAFFLSLGCANVSKDVDDSQPQIFNEVQKSETQLIPAKGLVMYKNEPFSGRTVSHYPNNSMSERITYLDGKKHGVREKWYDHGQISYKSIYTNGRQTDSSMTWWKDGQLRSISYYKEGKLHGQQRQWYRSGVLFKELNYEMGIASGMQRAWRENGKLYNNYEAKDGKVYGLKRSTLCYELEDETVQFGD